MSRYSRPSYALALGILALAGLSGVSCSSRASDSFFLEKAALAEIQTHVSLRQSSSLERSGALAKEFVLSGHRIVSGDGTVLALREFTGGSIFSPDHGRFWKLTIFLPFPIDDNEVSINLDTGNPIIAYWSQGSSNFPGKSGCHGYASGGQMKLKKQSNSQLSTELALRFDLVSPGGWKKECGPLPFNDKLVLGKRDVQSLTPWEGKPGAHAYEESIR